MSFRDRLWLRVTVGWTLFVWLVFTRNIVSDPDHSFGFKAVHVTLAIISIVLAVGVWVVASRARTRRHEEVRD
jgi:succinate-acetate transporter protein